ncbi:inositol monophosphatase family protein [Buchnera aphidicola (Neophyllaphis podocarpi)]|uniref:inositol monophosphatase family protein n=1 Tax=Buchnera aphidicola TaxID=9 RepID=UPI0031B87EC8
MNPMLNVAIKAVRHAGKLLVQSYTNQKILENINNKEHINNIIYKSRHLIIQIIKKYYPKHIYVIDNVTILKIIKEKNNKNIHWIINILDGKINFLKKYPHFAITIAIYIKNRTEISVIYDPMRNELFTSVRGRGAQINGYRMRCNNNFNLSTLSISTNYLPVFKEENRLDLYNKKIKNLIFNCDNLRFTGSKMLELVYLASNRIDLCIYFNIKPCILITCELQIRESGALITDLCGGNDYSNFGNILVGNSKIIQKVLKMII